MSMYEMSRKRGMEMPVGRNPMSPSLNREPSIQDILNERHKQRFMPGEAGSNNMSSMNTFFGNVPPNVATEQNKERILQNIPQPNPYKGDFIDSPIGQNMPPWLRKMLMGGEGVLPESPPAMDENYEIAGMGQGLGGLLGHSISGGMY